MKSHTRRRFHRFFHCLLACLAGYAMGSRLASAGVNVVKTVTGDEAQQHLQETNTVCGPIASTKYVDTLPAKPTYLNFDRAYPDQTCAVMIPGSARPKFKVPPETAFKGKTICVTGFITAVRGKPQITVDEPSQIVIEEPLPSITNNTDAGAAK